MALNCMETNTLFSNLKKQNKQHEEDWATEYLDLVLAVKIVEDVEEALSILTNTERNILKRLLLKVKKV